jgi:hypothetical protein
MTPPPLDRWIDAVLLLWMSLVQGVATTLGMWLRVGTRDWHTQSDVSALPQAKSDIHIKKDDTTHGVILGPVPRISVGPSKGLAADPLETHNQDSRHKAEKDSAGVAPMRANPIPVIPDARAACEPEPRGDKHIRDTQLLGSRSRVPRVGNDTAGV